MFAATGWDNSERDTARGWSVTDRLLERQQWHLQERAQARRREARRGREMSLMTAVQQDAVWRDEMLARWRGGWSVLAFLFAQPDSAAIRELDARGEYFNVRTGDKWDLFFPGYYVSAGANQQYGAKPVGRDFANNWYFEPMGFNIMRSQIEGFAGSRWNYSGGTDLVVTQAWIPERGEPVVDWECTKVGSPDPVEQRDGVSLSAAIERLSRDIENDSQDAHFGIAQLIKPVLPKRDDGVVKKVFIGALGGMLAAIGKSATGL